MTTSPRGQLDGAGHWLFVWLAIIVTMAIVFF